MSDWKRSTRELTFEQLPQEMRAEVLRHIELYNLGDILSDVVMCIQSDAEKPKKGLFGSAESNRTGVILTPNWLVWVVNGIKSPAAVVSALLQDVVIMDYADTPYAKMVPDSGIEVSGKFTDTIENSSAFIGLEKNAAGEKFKELVISTVQQAKK